MKVRYLIGLLSVFVVGYVVSDAFLYSADISSMNIRDRLALRTHNANLPMNAVSMLDYDKDGIPNDIEDRIGTDKYLFDTDSDDVGDYYEIMWPTNPNGGGPLFADLLDPHEGVSRMVLAGLIRPNPQVKLNLHKGLTSYQFFNLYFKARDIKVYQGDNSRIDALMAKALELGFISEPLSGVEQMKFEYLSNIDGVDLDSEGTMDRYDAFTVLGDVLKAEKASKDFYSLVKIRQAGDFNPDMMKRYRRRGEDVYGKVDMYAAAPEAVTDNSALQLLYKMKGGRSTTSRPSTPRITDSSSLAIADLDNESLTLVSGAEDTVMVFYVQNNLADAAVITSLEFDISLGNGAEADDVGSYDLFISYDDGNTYILKEEDVDPEGNTLAFTGLADDGYSGIVFSALEGAHIILRGDVAGDLSADGGEYRLSISKNNIEAEDTLGNSISDISGSVVYGAELALIDEGTIVIAPSDRYLDSALYVAGSMGNEFMYFDLMAEYESMTIDDLDFVLRGGFNDADGVRNYLAVDSISLWYEDGSPVKFDNGNNAVLSSISIGAGDTGLIAFDDLNLIAREGYTETIIVKQDLRLVGDDSGDTARDGSVISISLDSDVDVDGVTSGASIDGDNYTFTSPDEPEMMLVAAYPVLTLAADSPSSFGTNTNEEVFRFAVTNPANASNSDLWIKGFALETELTVGSDANYEITNYRIYDGSTSNGLLATCTNSSGGAVVVNSGSADVAYCNFENSGDMTITDGDSGFEIANSDSESLVLRVDISGNLGTGINSIKFSIPSFGSFDSGLGTDNASGAGEEYELNESGNGNTFASSSSDGHSLIWINEEGGELLHYLDVDGDFSSNRLSSL